MSLPVIICDDSSFARKQAERALPSGWDVDITFCTNGEEAIQALHQGKGDFLLLDLTMPVMDGFEVLEYIRAHDLPTVVIVISGDIQEDSHKRVMSLGAIAFIEKPIDPNQLSKVLADFGVYSAPQTQIANGNVSPPLQVSTHEDLHVNSPEFYDQLQEVSNVAMGQAADLLSNVIDNRVEISIPRVNLLEPTELDMTLHATANSNVIAINQGFIGRGIAGEIIIMLEQHDIDKIALLMGYYQTLTRSVTCELIMDVANILVGAFLKGFSEQLDINLSQGQPEIIIHENDDEEAITSRNHNNNILAIELSYTLGFDHIQCDQLILFTDASQSELKSLIEYTMW